MLGVYNVVSRTYSFSLIAFSVQLTRLRSVEDITLREQGLVADSEKEAWVEQSAEAEALLMAVAVPGDTNVPVEQRVVVLCPAADLMCFLSVPKLV